MKLLRLLLCAASFIWMAHAPASAQSFAEHSQALDQLDALFPTDGQTDIATFKANPKLQEYLTVVTDSQKFLDGMPHPLQDQALMCMRINNTVKKFFFFGIPHAERFAQDPKSLDAATRAAVGKNMTLFFPETGQLEVFGFKCSEKLVQHLIRSYDPGNTDPNYRNAVAQQKLNAFKLFFGNIAKSCTPPLPTDYKTRLSQTVADASPTFASILNRSQRGMIIGTIQKMAADVKEPPIAANIARIMQTLETTPCTPLCDL